MGELKADLDRLETLGATLRSLAAEATALRTRVAAGAVCYAPEFVMPSVLEASSITTDLIDSALTAAIGERLSETGEIMGHVAQQYRATEEASAASVAAAFTDATGDWTSQ